MNERLSASELDVFEASLVAAGKREGMSKDRKRALALALAGGTVAATIGATAGTAKAATTATAAAAATKAKGAAGLALLKWIAAAIAGSALAVGATTGAVHVYEAQHTKGASSAKEEGSRGKATKPEAKPHAPATASNLDSDRTSAPISAPDLVPAGAVAVVVPSDPDPHSGSAVAPAPSNSQTNLFSDRPTTARGTAPTEASPTPPGQRSASIVDELRTIERARTLLSASDLTGAARALDEHDRLFSNGAFAEEARVLRIDLHARRGEVTRARSEARAYLAAHPTSPYASRLRVLAGDDAGSPPKGGVSNGGGTAR